MKSLADNYAASHSSNHETIADLVFCALVVLLLFVLALSVEVSQRVRSEVQIETQATIATVEHVDTLTPEELTVLSEKLHAQSLRISELQSRLRANNRKLENQLSALSGEQRFTGAREPAAFSMAYDYTAKRYYFASSKDVDHADRRQSGESIFEYGTRKTRELASIALHLRTQRGFTQNEAKSLYAAASTYNEVVPSKTGYVLQQTDVGLYYHTLLSEYVAGDIESSDDHELLVANAIEEMGEESGGRSDQLYPRWLCRVETTRREIEVNGVVLAPNDLLEILLSVSGRGLLLDFEGYSGDAPRWLYDDVLMPAGYISKTPKLPQL